MDTGGSVLLYSFCSGAALLRYMCLPRRSKVLATHPGLNCHNHSEHPRLWLRSSLGWILETLCILGALDFRFRQICFWIIRFLDAPFLISWPEYTARSNQQF